MYFCVAFFTVLVFAFVQAQNEVPCGEKLTCKTGQYCATLKVANLYEVAYCRNYVRKGRICNLTFKCDPTLECVTTIGNDRYGIKTCQEAKATTASVDEVTPVDEVAPVDEDDMEENNDEEVAPDSEEGMEEDVE